MSRDRLGVVWAGLGLTGLGIAFLLAQWIGWDKIWPMFPLLGGLVFFAGYVASGFKDAGLTFVGTAATLIGLFFFGFTLGYWDWEEMAQLWPVFVAIGGVAFVVLFIAEGRDRDWGVLGIGLAAIVFGVVALAVTYGLLQGDVVKYWPLLIILLGFIGLVGALVRAFRRE
jgi:ATP/ADP translocase